jgi:hypothetical protein
MGISLTIGSPENLNARVARRLLPLGAVAVLRYARTPLPSRTLLEAASSRTTRMDPILWIRPCGQTFHVLTLGSVEKLSE